MLERFEPRHTEVAKNFLAKDTKTLAEMFFLRAIRTPDEMAWKQKQKGQWVKTTWKQFYDQAARLATSLIEHGTAPGDTVCIMGPTVPQWCICDMGGILAGAITVGAYPTLAPAQLVYLLDHSDTRVLFVGGKDEVEKVLGVKNEIPKLDLMAVWNTDGLDDILAEHAWIKPFDDFLKIRPNEKILTQRREDLDPLATAIIVYTSGTTGPPKGALITHENVMTMLNGQKSLLPVDKDDFAVSFLPMAHVAERILSFYGRISGGMGTAFASSIPAVIDEVQEVKPTFFGSVPRIFEKAYAKIFSEVEKAPPRRQKLFAMAEKTGREVVQRWQAGEEIPLGLTIRYLFWDKLVFRKIRDAFGGRVKFFVTGAAPIAPEILEFFWAAGCPVFEVYGQTEGTALSHCNRPGAVRLGSVGKPFDFAECKIAEDGEILVRGKTVFAGYHKNPEATAETVDEDGWLYTGDIGRIDEDGFLYIVDRKKHIIITAGGKNLTPANMENEIKAQDPLISQAHVHGDRRPYLTAIITVHPIDAVEYARDNGLLKDMAKADALLETLMGNPLARPKGLDTLMTEVTSQKAIKDRIIRAVRDANKKVARVETIKRIHILDRDFSLEEGEVTPTLKVKRKNIEEKFTQLFDKLYQDKNFGIAVM